jgi:hypothetical protein
MGIAPQHDWNLYADRTRESEAHWARQLTPQQRFDVYRDFFNVVHAAKQISGDSQPGDQWSWRQKLALRRRMVDAFTKLDGVRLERSATNDAR